MHERKNAAIRIERQLLEHGGARMLSAIGEERVYLYRSPTVWVLRFVPLLLGGAWVVVLALF